MILDAAGVAFATRTYSEITLKEIADDADVSAPLVIKYYGSKEALFDTLVDFHRAAALLFDRPRESVGERFITLPTQQNEPHTPLSVNILFMSGSSEENNRKLRENYSRQVIDSLAARLPRTQTRVRAELATSMVIGLAIMRRRVVREFTTGSVDEFIVGCAPLVQQLIDG